MSENLVSSDPSSPSNKSKLIIIATVLIFFLILLFLATVFLKNNRIITPNNPESKITPVENQGITSTAVSISPVTRKTQSLTIDQSTTGLTRLQIAEKVLQYLSGMKDNRNAFLSARQCSASNMCLDADLSNNSGPRPIWARLKYYQKTQKQSDLTIINSDFDINLNKKIVWTLQNDFWNCKLMIDGWKNSLLDTNLKKKIYDLCHISLINPYNYDQIDEIINSKLVDKPDFPSVMSANTYQNPNYVEVDNTNNGLFNTAFYSSEHSALYQFDKKEINLKTAGLFFNQALHMYFSNHQSINKESVCVMGESALDLYRANNDIGYLNLAKYFWDKEKIDNPTSDSNIFREKVICSFFTNSLYLLSKDKKYQTARNKYLDDLINNFFDYQGYGGYYAGDGSFRGNLYNNMTNKYSSYNSLLVGLLTED